MCLVGHSARDAQCAGLGQDILIGVWGRWGASKTSEGCQGGRGCPWVVVGKHVRPVGGQGGCAVPRTPKYQRARCPLSLCEMGDGRDHWTVEPRASRRSTAPRPARCPVLNTPMTMSSNICRTSNAMTGNVSIIARPTNKRTQRLHIHCIDQDPHVRRGWGGSRKIVSTKLNLFDAGATKLRIKIFQTPF